MKLSELFAKLEEGKSSARSTALTLQELGITEEKIKLINAWAREYARGGEVASYIPELKNVNPDLSAIAIGDMLGGEIVVGNGADYRASIQSVIKPFLYLYALQKGMPPEEIAGVEPNALPFNEDRILQPGLHLKRPDHPLNNAGAISAAGAIKQFCDFLEFMRLLARNPQLDVLEAVFDSEMKTNETNRAIAYRLVASGRFKERAEGEQALEFYTKACALGTTVRDIMRAGLVVASGGLQSSEDRIVHSDHTVRVMAAMNSYGMYEQSAFFSLIASGSRANTVKSGVGGIILNIDPKRGAFVTFGPSLNTAGNSVYGIYAMIPLNHLLSAPGALCLSVKETERLLNLL